MAQKDKRAAEIGRIRADQTDTFYRENLNTTIANIESIRAAANIDPSSPTSAAIIANETRISDREREIKIASLRAQAAEDDASALFRRKAGEDALLGSYLSAGATVGGSLGRAFARGGGGGSLGNSHIGDPTKISALYLVHRVDVGTMPIVHISTITTATTKAPATATTTRLFVISAPEAASRLNA